MKEAFTLYVAGGLFDHKDLIGNALLAEYIEKCSGGRYRCCLPQNIEQHETTALDIRNKDIAKIIACDMGLFNFEGTELDAGMVAEFMLAKFLDIPAVILRSDFRSCGEKGIGGDDWNIMCSFYPRTRIVQFNALSFYRQAAEQSKTLDETLDVLYSRIAGRIVDSLDSVRSEEPLLQRDQEKLQILYRWALTFPGGGIDTLNSDASFVDQILAAKMKKGLVS